jgi:hypothetical protein
MQKFKLISHAGDVDGTFYVECVRDDVFMGANRFTPDTTLHAVTEYFAAMLMNYDAGKIPGFNV